jgi:hypothetical protein
MKGGFLTAVLVQNRANLLLPWWTATVVWSHGNPNGALSNVRPGFSATIGNGQVNKSDQGLFWLSCQISACMYYFGLMYALGLLLRPFNVLPGNANKLNRTDWHPSRYGNRTRWNRSAHLNMFIRCDQNAATNVAGRSCEFPRRYVALWAPVQLAQQLACPT